MPLTIDNCDQEPIHIPGAIQPHGYLLAFAESDLRLRQASANAPALLGIDEGQLFQLPLEALVGEAAAAVLRTHRGARTWKRFNPIATEIAGRKLDAVVHRSGELVVVELESAGLPIDAAALPCATDLPDLRGLGRALGALYVLEGSTLGGQVLAREVTRGAAGVPTAFLHGAGEATGQRWTSFCRFAEEMAAGQPGVAADALAVAGETFAALAAWLRR